MSRTRTRPSKIRTRDVEVLGVKTTIHEELDPEKGDGAVATAWSGLGPKELDRLRAERDGVPYLPIEEAERIRKSRPSKDQARRMDIGEQLMHLAQAAWEKRAVDDVEEDRLAESKDRKAVETENRDEKAKAKR